MADVNRYPIADVTSMAELTGFNMTDIRSWTDALLDAKMAEWQAGTLTGVVNIGQGQRPPEEVFRQTFISGVGHDVSEIGIALSEAARALGRAPGEIARRIEELGDLLPILLIGGLAAALFILAKK